MHSLLMYDKNSIHMIEKNSEFLKISSRLLKIIAWTFLLFGGIQALAIFVRIDKSVSIGVGCMWLIVCASVFLLLYHITLLGDVVIEIGQFLKKERF